MNRIQETVAQITSVDRALLEQLSRRAVHKASSYRWRETAARYVAIFERLTEDRAVADHGSVAEIEPSQPFVRRVESEEDGGTRMCRVHQEHY